MTKNGLRIFAVAARCVTTANHIFPVDIPIIFLEHEFARYKTALHKSTRRTVILVRSDPFNTM